MSVREFAAPLAVLALAPTLLAQSTVFVVDDSPGPGVDFGDLPPAIAAAADGDILVVRDGIYSSFTIDGKGLTVVADNGGQPRISGPARVERLRAAQTVVLRGLRTFVPTNVGLVLTDNRGAIFVEDCSLAGGNGMQGAVPAHPDGYDALIVSDCDNVSFTHCIFNAGDGADQTSTEVNGLGGAGLRAARSRIALFDCTFFGGDGGGDLSNTGAHGNHGGPGGSLNVGLVVSASSTFLGGRGGSGGVSSPSNACGNGGNGGDGFYLQDGQFSEVYTSLLSGLGGGGAAAFGCRNGSDGAPFVRQNGTRMFLVGGTRGDFEAPAPLRPGTTTNLPIRGRAGDIAVLAISIAPAFLYEPAASGVLLVGGQSTWNVLGIIPATGALLVPLTHPGILRRRQGVLIHAQTAFVGIGGAAVLGPFSIAVLTGP